jgi:hypothetical protein
MNECNERSRNLGKYLTATQYSDANSVSLSRHGTLPCRGALIAWHTACKGTHCHLFTGEGNDSALISSLDHTGSAR